MFINPTIFIGVNLLQWLENSKIVINIKLKDNRTKLKKAFSVTPQSEAF